MQLPIATFCFLQFKYVKKCVKKVLTYEKRSYNFDVTGKCKEMNPYIYIYRNESMYIYIMKLPLWLNLHISSY